MFVCVYVSNKRSDYLTKEETNTSLTAIAIEVSPMKKVKEMKVLGYSGHIKRPVREKSIWRANKRTATF